MDWALIGGAVLALLLLVASFYLRHPAPQERTFSVEWPRLAKGCFNGTTISITISKGKFDFASVKVTPPPWALASYPSSPIKLNETTVVNVTIALPRPGRVTVPVSLTLWNSTYVKEISFEVTVIGVKCGSSSTK